MKTGRKPSGYIVIDEKGGRVGVLVDFEEYQKLQDAAAELKTLRQTSKGKRKAWRKKYSFSDLAGRLQWKGDPLAEQRRLRDEW